VKLFDLDGPFQRYGTMVFDILVVNTLWFIITFFTFGLLSGPAMTSSYGSLYASVVSGEGYMFKQFFTVFKKRFFISFFFGLISLALTSLSLLNIYMILTGTFGSTWLLPIYLFIFIEISFISVFAYPLIAHTNLKYQEVIRMSFILSNKHLPTALLASILQAVIYVLVVFVLLGAVDFFIYLFIAGGLVFSLNSYLVAKRCLKTYDFFEGNL